MYHISPKDRQTRSFKSECLDSSGKPKQSYLTEKEAITRRDIILKEQGKKLFVYKCEQCNYFHLTHKDFQNNADNKNNGVNNNNENIKQNTNTNSNDKKCIIF